MANEAEEFRPQPPSIVLRQPFAGDTDGLTGEPSADEVDGFKVIRVQLLDVAVTGNVGPVLCEHLGAVGIILNLPAAFHARSVKTKIETSHTTEEASVGEGHLVVQSGRHQ